MIRYVIFCALTLMPVLLGRPREVSFSQPPTSIQAYDFAEITVTVAAPDVRNPFIDATLHGSFGKSTGERTAVEGFCDSPDGSVFRIRFMPSSSGDYSYSITYKQGDFEKSQTGATSSGKAPASITSSTALRRSGCWVGGTRTPSNTRWNACIVSRSTAFASCWRVTPTSSGENR
jgi:Domain of unknown function (DUF5060)